METTKNKTYTTKATKAGDGKKYIPISDDVYKAKVQKMANDLNVSLETLGCIFADFFETQKGMEWAKAKLQ